MRNSVSSGKSETRGPASGGPIGAKDRPLSFPNWSEALEASNLPARMRKGYAITIRWYLSFCKRARCRVTNASARSFIETVQREKRPNESVLEAWRNALRWFFANAPKDDKAGARGNIGRGELAEEDVQADPLPREGEGWLEVFLRTVRVRHMGFRTERSYLGWIRRFAEHSGTNQLERLGEAEIKAYLDHLAVKERIAASTQRQALNALVFLYREVFERELGDFSNYLRGLPKARIPVVLSRAEIDRLIEALPERRRLIALLQYGSGLRASELLRLRVKDLDFEQGHVIVRQGIRLRQLPSRRI